MVITYYEKENEKRKHILIKKRKDRKEKQNEKIRNTLNRDVGFYSQFLMNLL